MLERSLWHKSITDDAILGMMERRTAGLDDPGFCLICGNEAEGVEPDARNYTCEACGAEQVFGVFELVIAVA